MKDHAQTCPLVLELLDQPVPTQKDIEQYGVLCGLPRDSFELVFHWSKLKHTTTINAHLGRFRMPVERKASPHPRIRTSQVARTMNQNSSPVAHSARQADSTSRRLRNGSVMSNLTEGESLARSHGDTGRTVTDTTDVDEYPRTSTSTQIPRWRRRAEMEEDSEVTDDRNVGANAHSAGPQAIQSEPDELPALLVDIGQTGKELQALADEREQLVDERNAIDAEQEQLNARRLAVVANIATIDRESSLKRASAIAKNRRAVELDRV